LVGVDLANQFCSTSVTIQEHQIHWKKCFVRCY